MKEEMHFLTVLISGFKQMIVIIIKIETKNQVKVIFTKKVFLTIYFLKIRFIMLI